MSSCHSTPDNPDEHDSDSPDIVDSTTSFSQKHHSSQYSSHATELSARQYIRTFTAKEIKVYWNDEVTPRAFKIPE